MDSTHSDERPLYRGAFRDSVGESNASLWRTVDGFRRSREDRPELKVVDVRGMGPDLVDRMDGEPDQQTVFASHTAFQHVANGAGRNPGRRQVHTVGSHSERDVEAIIHDQQRPVSCRRRAQTKREVEKLGAGILAGAKLNDERTRRAGGAHRGEDAGGGQALVGDDAEKR